MRSFARPLFALAVAAACALAAPSACSSGSAGLADGGNNDGGPDSGTSDGGPDGGKADGGDGGTTASLCTSDAQCGGKRYCEKASGACRDAKACPSGQGNCDYQSDPGSPDYCGGSHCFCDPGDSACKPIHTFCSPCTRSQECGNDRLAYDFPADCVAPDAGYATKSVCIPRKENGCPSGYRPTATSGIYCAPAGGACGSAGACTTDNDCDPHGATPLCNTAQGLCVAACSFDLLTGDSPACVQGQTCNLDTRLLALPPSEVNWGKGRCAPICTSATNCGAGLTCRTEGYTRPVQRCTIPLPGCLGDLECPESPTTHAKGYCDLAARACRTDCRTNNDCKAGYICDSHSCQPTTCTAAGGATFACDYGQFCCGETSSPTTCSGGATTGQCYDAPKVTWCATCSKDDECAGAAFPKGTQKNVCLDSGGANNAKVCWIGCDPSGPDAQCPRSWQCQPVTYGCKSASDCGNQAGAKCDNPDGGQGSCGCSADADCPNDAQNHSYCYKSHCTVTTACRPACQ